MKIALIGCGFFAMNQLHGWQGIESATVVALCDRDPERLKVASDLAPDAHTYTDAAEMFNEGGVRRR